MKYFYESNTLYDFDHDGIWINAFKIKDQWYESHKTRSFVNYNFPEELQGSTIELPPPPSKVFTPPLTK